MIQLHVLCSYASQVVLQYIHALLSTSSTPRERHGVVRGSNKESDEEVARDQSLASNLLK